MKATKIITALLAVLGFSACNWDDGKDLVMYGPASYGGFEVKGKVSDGEKPIEGIKVTFKFTEGNYTHNSSNGMSDAEGNYHAFDDTRPFTAEVAVTAEDIDGPENGGDFATKTTKIIVNKSDFVGADGNFFLGKATKEVDFVLEPKPAPEPETPDPDPTPEPNPEPDPNTPPAK